MTKTLQKIPGFSRGVRDNAAQRMMKLNRPICPNSKEEMEWDRNGKPVPKEKGPDIQNCQLAGGRWWEACEELGHNPYFMAHKWYTFEDIIEPDERGRLIKKSEQAIAHQVTYPNLAQVAISVRINQGNGAKNAIEKKGFRRLRDAGYEEACQFRNCQKPVIKTATSRKYGAYCSLEHLQLIVADAESVMLVQGALSATNAKQAQRKREHQLREISIGAVE